jgi:hypothetical protein
MSKYFKAGAKVFEYLKPKPKVNKTELDKAKSKLDILKHKTKMSRAKLNQTLFEITNKKDLTFKTNKEKTLSNTERKKKADARKKEKKQETKTKHFYAPKNFNKGGRVGLKKGGESDLGMQSVKYGLDNNPDVTKADPKAKFIAAAKKSKKKVI